MRVAVSVILMFSAVLSGCGDSKSPPDFIKDVSWFQENKEALDAQLKECANNPGTLAATPNCINAQQAAHNNMSGPSKTDYSKAFK